GRGLSRGARTPLSLGRGLSRGARTPLSFGRGLSRGARTSSRDEGGQLHYPSRQMNLAGQTFNMPTDLLNLLQGDIAVIDAADKAHADWLAAVQAQRAQHQKVGPVLRALQRLVLAQFGDTQDAASTLADFGGRKAQCDAGGASHHGQKPEEGREGDGHRTGFLADDSWREPDAGSGRARTRRRSAHVLARAPSLTTRDSGSSTPRPELSHGRPSSTGPALASPEPPHYSPAPR
ncbi:MAG TPA: hypothetical protein VHV30_00030, partial [Polyangiaceae bacterium]|nr:hypothetical protein [Polyangiaceae bacterium]